MQACTIEGRLYRAAGRPAAAASDQANIAISVKSSALPQGPLLGWLTVGMLVLRMVGGFSLYATALAALQTASARQAAAGRWQVERHWIQCVFPAIDSHQHPSRALTEPATAWALALAEACAGVGRWGGGRL